VPSSVATAKLFKLVGTSSEKNLRVQGCVTRCIRSYAPCCSVWLSRSQSCAHWCIVCPRLSSARRAVSANLKAPAVGTWETILAGITFQHAETFNILNGLPRGFWPASRFGLPRGFWHESGGIRERFTEIGGHQRQVAYFNTAWYSVQLQHLLSYNRYTVPGHWSHLTKQNKIKT